MKRQAFFAEWNWLKKASNAKRKLKVFDWSWCGMKSMNAAHHFFEMECYWRLPAQGKHKSMKLICRAPQTLFINQQQRKKVFFLLNCWRSCCANKPINKPTNITIHGVEWIVKCLVWCCWWRLLNSLLFCWACWWVKEWKELKDWLELLDWRQNL